MVSLANFAHLVVWAGPVSASNLAGAALPVPSQVLTINSGDGGIGSTNFANLARRYGTLSELVGHRGIDLDRCLSVTLAVFSAGHGLAEVLLRDDESFARIDALVAADAYYTSKGAGPKPGYRAFCERAAAGGALAVLSTSGIGGPGYDSSQKATETLLEGIALDPSETPTNLPPPASAERAGGLFWFKYGSKYGLGAKAHTMHATQVAPAVLTSMVTPYLQRKASDAHDQSAELALATAGLLLVAAGGL